MQMTVEEYQHLKAERKTDTKIAIAKDVSPQTLYNWKKKHENELKSAKKDTKTAENVQKVNDSANQLVAGKFSVKVKEQQKVISKLQEESAGRLRQIDALVEDKRKWLEERDKLKSGIEPSQIASLKGQLDTEKKLNESVHHNLGIAQKTIVQLRNEKDDLLKSTQNQAGTIDVLHKNLDSTSTLYREKCKQIADLNAAAEDLENEISQLKDDKNDLEHQLAYTGQERDKYFKLARRYGQQLKALEAYVVTILESAK